MILVETLWQARGRFEHERRDWEEEVAHIYIYMSSLTSIYLLYIYIYTTHTHTPHTRTHAHAHSHTHIYIYTHTPCTNVYVHKSIILSKVLCTYVQVLYVCVPRTMYTHTRTRTRTHHIYYITSYMCPKQNSLSYIFIPRRFSSKVDRQKIMMIWKNLAQATKRASAQLPQSLVEVPPGKS